MQMSKQNVVPLITPGLKVACFAMQSARTLPAPSALDDTDMARLDSLIGGRPQAQARAAPLPRRRCLRNPSSPCVSGFFKTDVLTEDGRDQVTGFQMARRKSSAWDGISTEHHTCKRRGAGRQRSLPDPVLPKLELLSSEIHSLQHHLHKVMSREIVRDHGVMMFAWPRCARKERLAAFLLNLSQRFQCARLFALRSSICA
jgi:CRP/FNR family transcriptional regulator